MKNHLHDVTRKVRRQEKGLDDRLLDADVVFLFVARVRDPVDEEWPRGVEETERGLQAIWFHFSSLWPKPWKPEMHRLELESKIAQRTGRKSTAHTSLWPPGKRSIARFGFCIPCFVGSVAVSRSGSRTNYSLNSIHARSKSNGLMEQAMLRRGPL